MVREVGIHLEDSRMDLKKKKWHLMMKVLKHFRIGITMLKTNN